MPRFVPSILVKNPRNLERLKIARKNEGYEFERDKPFRNFYYKIGFELNKGHTTGSLRHFKDGIVITASTKEWPIAKRLYSNSDVSAAENIGYVLARRCLQAGITSAIKDCPEERIVQSEKICAFFSALNEGGVKLEEEPPLEPCYETDKRFHWTPENIERDKETPI